VSSAAEIAATGWLRGPAFDLAFVGGVLALALGLGTVGTLGHAAFAAVLAVDLWLLAYPHVASTFTRVAFDRESARRHAFVLIGLPPLVLAGTAGVAWLGGAIALNTLYFAWQSVHYARQSDGIARAYRRASGAPTAARDHLTDLVVYAFPIWGVLHRIDQRPTAFYGAPILVPPVPGELVPVAGAVAVTALLAWAVRQSRALRHGEPVLGLTLHVVSHVIITVVSHLVIEDITRGWLFINIWHNAQYLPFVWAANARRHQLGVDPRRRFASWLSQPRNVAWYAAVCLALGAGFYLLLGRASAALPRDVLPMVLVAHLAVNFHHYLIDTVIWRAPRATSR
jgi:hypothetical protein